MTADATRRTLLGLELLHARLWITRSNAYRHPAEGYNQLFVDPTVAARSDGMIEAPILPFTAAVWRFA